MNNLELCQKLKAAGAGQEMNDGDWYYDVEMCAEQKPQLHHHSSLQGEGYLNKYLIKIHYLSELLEMCKDAAENEVAEEIGYTTVYLIWNASETGEWEAGVEGHDTDKGCMRIIYSIFADTPEEAVALLWLKLKGE